MGSLLEPQLRLLMLPLDLLEPLKVQRLILSRMMLVLVYLSRMEPDLMLSLLASTSAMITLDLAPSLKDTPTPASSLMRLISAPLKVPTDPVVTSAALTVAPAMTCLATMAVFCSVVKVGMTSAILAKASSVGAKTVAASTLLKVSTRPSSLTSATKVVKPSNLLATSTRLPGPAVLVAGAGAGAGFFGLLV